MNLNQIYNENCTTTLARLPDEFLDMTLTSPPYDDLRAYEGFDFSAEEVAALLLDRTKRGGVAVWVVGDRTQKGSETLMSYAHAIAFKRARLAAGFNRRSRRQATYIRCFYKTAKQASPQTGRQAAGIPTGTRGTQAAVKTGVPEPGAE